MRMNRMGTRGLAALTLGLAMAPAAWAQRTSNAAGDLPGPIDNVQDLEDTGKMLFKVADANNDGRISQQEAVDAGNLLVGGFFFQADADGDGKITKQEAQKAREALMQQRPWLRYVMSKGNQQQKAEGQPTSNDALRSLGSLLDRDDDKAIEATEVRQAVQTAVQSLYAVADTSHDGALDPSEVNAAVAGTVQAIAQAMFQTADKDQNGTLSQEEFLQSLAEPARTAFSVLDANGDKQLTPQEIQTAERVILSQLRNLQVPDAGNGSSAREGNTTAAPNIRIPVRTNAAPNAAPGRVPTAPAPGQPAPAPGGRTR